jgi:energy-converting hydrogenase B subunit D
MTWDLMSILALVVVLVVLISAVLVLTLDNLIGAVAVSSVVSLGVSVLFVLLHAPDVAMTEAAVGTGLSGVVLALGLRRLGLWRLEGDHGARRDLVPENLPPARLPKVRPSEAGPDA